MEIKIKDFEGPLDLLLHLVSKYEMDIYDVPIADVIEQYLAYIKTLQAMRLEVAGEYMVMASQLMLIKSKKLLPKVASQIVDEEDLEQELLEQIEEYSRYKIASQYLGKQHAKRTHFFSKEKTELVYEDIELLPDKTVIDLFLAFSKVISEHQSKGSQMETTVAAEDYKIEDMMVEIDTILSANKQILLSQLFSKRQHKNELITLFLAILELIKVQSLRIEQSENFGEILLMKEER